MAKIRGPVIRPVAPSEIGFVVKGWIRTYATSDWALLLTPKDDDHTRKCASCARRSLRLDRNSDKTVAHAGPAYWSRQHEIITNLLARCNVSVLEADDGLLEGFVVRDRESPVLHYVYVKPLARRQGKAREMVSDLSRIGTRVSHLGAGIRLPHGWSFDPGLAFP
jgi:hypothetical protein